MLRRMRTVVVIVGTSVVMCAGAFGQETVEQSGSDVQEQLRALTDEIKGLRHDNEAMRVEVDELRAETRSDWLTERRADEIRGLVQDVLADADTRASLLDDGLIAGWSDHFFLASPDGRFKLSVGGQLQVRWVFNFRDAEDKYRTGFENTRTKLLFGGHVFSPDWEYFVETNFDSISDRDGDGDEDDADAVLEDAYIRHYMNNDVSFRFGQFRLPFTREFMVNSSKQLAVERSIIDGAVNIGRSQGFELTFSDASGRFIVAFSDGGTDNLGNESSFFSSIASGLFPPSNTPALDYDTEYAVTARYEMLLAGSWKQFEDFTSPQGEEYGVLLGAAFHSQQQEGGTPGPRERRWLAWTADVSIEYGGANIFAAFTHHYIDDPNYFMDIYGLVVQGGVYLTPKWEVFGRYEYGWTDLDHTNTNITRNGRRSDLGVATFGANYYIDGHDLKWSSDIGFGVTQVEDFWANGRAGYRDDPEGAEPQIVIRTQLQLLF